MFGEVVTFLTSATLGTVLVGWVFFASVVVIVLAGMDDWKRSRSHS